MGFKDILSLVYVTQLRPKHISRASIALLGTFLCKLNDLYPFVVFGHRVVFRSQFDVHALVKYDHTDVRVCLSAHKGLHLVRNDSLRYFLP